MLWLFRKLFDRLATKLMLVAAAKVDSEMEMELGFCRAEMLRVADELEQSANGRNEAIAETLRRRAERLGYDGKGPASEVVDLVQELREENLQEAGRGIERHAIGSSAGKALPSPAPKKRGRPRKNPEIPSGNDTGTD